MAYKMIKIWCVRELQEYDDTLGFWSERFMILLEKSWKYERFWKWYYRIIPVFVVIMWIFIVISDYHFSSNFTNAL